MHSRGSKNSPTRMVMESPRAMKKSWKALAFAYPSLGMTFTALSEGRTDAFTLRWEIVDITLWTIRARFGRRRKRSGLSMRFRRI